MRACVTKRTVPTSFRASVTRTQPHVTCKAAARSSRFTGSSSVSTRHQLKLDMDDAGGARSVR